MVEDPITAEVVSCAVKHGVVRTVLRLSRLPSEPIAPASLHSLGQGHEKIVELHKIVKAAKRRLTFETYVAAGAPIRAGETYRFSPWWARWQLELVTDTSKSWRRQRFEPSDAALMRTDSARLMRKSTDAQPDDEGELVRGGWDHEHCGLCCVKIWQGEPGAQEGYTDGRNWLCPSCYDKFVASGLGPRLA